MSPIEKEMADNFYYQILGKKDILAVLHPGAPEAESASLGTKQRRSNGKGNLANFFFKGRPSYYLFTYLVGDFSDVSF